MGFGLAILSFAEATLAQVNNSDLTDASPQGQIISTPVNTVNGNNFTFEGNTPGETATYNSQQISGNISIPQDIVTTITGSGRPTVVGTNGGNLDGGGIVGTSNDTTVGENSSTGNNSDNTITRRSVSTGTDTGESTTGDGIAAGPNTNESSGSEISPDQIVICLSDPCGSSDSSSANTISVNELAKLIEEDLNQALNDLAAAERGELNLDENSISQDLTDNPRRIVRRQSSSDLDRITRRDSLVNEDCGCVPGERKIVREPSSSGNSTISQNAKALAEARQIVETKLEQSSKFVEQMNQFRPDNSIW